MKRLSRILLVAVAIAVMACQRTPQPVPLPTTKTEWIDRPDAFQEHYTLEQMVVLSRHNIRTPMRSLANGWAKKASWPPIPRISIPSASTPTPSSAARLPPGSSQMPSSPERAPG